jgi:RHS repeat-associated protein
VAVVVQETHYDPWGLELAGIGYVADPAKEHRWKYNGGVERLGDFGLHWDESGARMYDMQVPRFLGVDPLADKEGQESWTPYHYGFNNPARFIDPDGIKPSDIIILNSSKGANGNGHAAVLIGNQKTGWTYISKDGPDNTLGNFTGAAPRFTIMQFGSIDEFANSDHNLELGNGGYHAADPESTGRNGSDNTRATIWWNDLAHEKDGFPVQRYDNALYIDTDESTNEAMIQAAKSEARKDYQLMGSDCSHVPEAALAAGKDRNGQPLATGKGTVGPLPPSGMGNGFDLGIGAGTAASFNLNSPNEKFLRIVEGNRKVSYDANNMIIPQAVRNR